ncbi:unnamed protein product [Protopolystoma xenopodis]|uniref:Uncharacterized protein n=1 Tax=Protopolystoma xenopodis TaxID=117903 RepID=A0A3S5CJI1_9PLAT|nr:unnamed protein product [Protopolystoma xenopodis]
MHVRGYLAQLEQTRRDLRAHRLTRPDDIKQRITDLRSKVDQATVNVQERARKEAAAQQAAQQAAIEMERQKKMRERELSVKTEEEKQQKALMEMEKRRVSALLDRYFIM